MSQQKILITGTGRCRTAWAAKWLRSTGMDITHQGIRHEHVAPPSAGFCAPLTTMYDLSIANERPSPYDPRNWKSTVSFEAAPHAEALAQMGWRVVLLIRDPAAVVRSWLSLGAFSDAMPKTHTEWWGSLDRWAPEVCRAHDPIERATRFYVRWNQLAMLADPHCLTVEGMTTEHLADAVGVISNRDAPDPGVVDEGTPGRIPVSLNDAQKRWVRQQAWVFLPEQFHYHRDGHMDDEPLHPAGHA